ncbi:hypothetical protein UFOVP434_28 [uncultured Caudovirales phage]|uniref:Uncharacterized protein n=1 Tax=uncultured Caudovirales phage TaxID=2100421 RepID=A0A6J5M7E9_9CAUD|nr:hypothetical protein UFOVP434_28 [uncultured Caudovirales phage]
MNRFKFLSALFLAPLAFAQSVVNKNQIKTRQNATGVPLQDVQLLGNYGESEFLEIRLGAGLAAQMKTVGTDSFIEIVSTVQPQPAIRELTIPATRNSNNRYSVTAPPANLANRNLRVYYNGLFMTPEFDYSRDGDSAVIFKYIVADNSTVTFVYSGV